MKRIKQSLFAALSLSLCCGTAMAADDSGLYLAPEVGYVLPTDGNVDDTIFLGIRLGYDFNENLAAEVESGWMQFGYDTDGGAQNIDIDSVPIMANLRFSGRCDSGLGGYLLAGVGGVWNEVQNGGPVELDNSIAWQVGAGVDYMISNESSVFGDVRYLWNNPDVTVNGRGLEGVGDPDIDLGSVMFTAGVKF